MVLENITYQPQGGLLESLRGNNKKNPMEGVWMYEFSGMYTFVALGHLYEADNALTLAIPFQPQRVLIK